MTRTHSSLGVALAQSRRSPHYASLRSKNISRKKYPHRDLSTALRFGRDDRGKGRYGPEQRSRDGETAGPFTALRSGRSL
jgi:hypothetical protein